MRRILQGVAIASLAGCSMGHQNPTEIKKALNEAANEANSRPLMELPSAVNADLMPSLDGGINPVNSSLEKRFRVNAKNVEAGAFFTSLVKGTPFNIVIHPGVSGRITMKLNDVTLDEVLNVASDIYGYNTTRKGNIIQVFPALRTEVIPVDYLQLQRRGKSLTSITSGSIADSDSSSSSSNDDNNSNNNSSNGNTTTGGTTIETTSDSDFWVQLEKVVSGMIGSGDGRSVMVSTRRFDFCSRVPE